MKVTNLCSSSSGNATIIETETTRIMVDAGTSFKKMAAAYGSDDFKLDALFITHEHSDHVSGAGTVGRKKECPIFIPEKSFEKKAALFNKCLVNYVNGGDEIVIGDLEIKSYNTKHDSEACVGYTIRDLNTDKCFGFLTDTGAITKLVRVSLEKCDALFIECDYDEKMLEEYPLYDDFLKNRIRSQWGHLSNQEALTYLKTYVNLDKVEWIILGHLSERTNSPDLLKQQVKKYLPEKYWEKIYVATEPLTLELK